MKKMSITLCMIVKNEEATLSTCLSSIKDFVDEMIIVDTGSTDKTNKIALKYTDKVYDFVWCNDFSKARNFSLTKASNDWVLKLSHSSFAMLPAIWWFMSKGKNKYLSI